MATKTITAQPLTAVINDITFSDTGTFNIGNLPPKAVVLKVDINVTTAFNSATSDAITIGYGAFGSTAADPDAFAASTDLQSAGVATVSPLLIGEEIESELNVPLTATISSAGGSLSAGAVSVVVQYAQK